MPAETRELLLTALPLLGTLADATASHECRCRAAKQLRRLGCRAEVAAQPDAFYTIQSALADWDRPYR